MTILKQTDFEVPAFGEFATPPVAVPGYAQAINAFAPLAYWRMGEQSGTTVADETGNHPLTLSGSYSLNQPGALSTDSDAAIHLVNASASATAAVLPTGAAGAFTLIFWMRVPGAIATNAPFVHQTDSSTTGGLQIVLFTDGRLLYKVIGDPGLTSSAAVSSQWKMFVLTRTDTGTASWYIDGQPDVSNTGHGNAILNTPLILGTNAPKVPNILLDEAAVLDEALSAEQVRWLHGLGTGQLTLPPGY